VIDLSAIIYFDKEVKQWKVKTSFRNLDAAIQAYKEINNG
jgi:hypothetical protein